MTTSADVPARLPCAIDGHAYLCEADYERTTVDVIRQQSDASSEPGEQSLSPYGLWRRSQESWHHGAGQEFLDGRDEKAADPHRFRSSKGIDPWTRGQVSLFNKTLKIWSTAATNLAVLQVSDGGAPPINDLYIVDGTELYFSDSPANLLAFNTSEIETSAAGWSAGANTTLSRSTAWAHQGVASLQLTPTAAGTISANTPPGTSGVPVDPGRVYNFTGWLRAVTDARVWSAYVDWYDAAGAALSTSTFTFGLSDATGTDTGFGTSGGATAPAGAAFASVRFSLAATSGAADIHRADSFRFGPQINIGDTAFKTAGIQAGQAAQTVQSATTNGTYLWAALGTSGIHRTIGGQITSTADVPAAPGGGQISLVGWANGFLLAAGGTVATTVRNVLWLVSDPLGTPALSLIKTHPDLNFVWTGLAPGRGCVYAFGNTGTGGEVYKILFDPNTGTLSPAASFATYLPDGEMISALTFYAGGIIMGTSLGVRLGQADGQGNIDYGPLIRTTYPVRCLEPQDRWCWYGWSYYDGTSTGLGRVDLGYFTDTLTPAYASDLMGTAQGEVLSACTFIPYTATNVSNLGEARVFAVSGIGVFYEDSGAYDNYRVPSGTLDTGTIRFSTSEPKTARSLDVRHHALPAGGSVAASMQRESSGTWTSLGSSTTATSYGPAVPLDAQSLTAEALEFRFTLARATDPKITPELTRWTAKVLPTPSTIDETFTLNLLMDTQIETNEGESIPLDVPTELAYIKTLEEARTIVQFQVGSDTFTGYVVKSQFKGRNWMSPARQYSEGTLTVVLQTVRG